MLPWAQAGSRFTNLFEALAIDVLLAANVKKAAEILRITWDEAWHLMERAVLRGRDAKGDDVPTQIGVDEKAIAKGHTYVTLVSDLDRGTVEFIARLPARQVGLIGGLPPQGKTKLRQLRVRAEVHVRPILVTRLMVAMLQVVLLLGLARSVVEQEYKRISISRGNHE